MLVSGSRLCDAFLFPSILGKTDSKNAQCIQELLED